MIMAFKRNSNIFALYPHPYLYKYNIPSCVRLNVISYIYIIYNIIYHYNTSGDPFHFLASTYMYNTNLFILIIEPRRYSQ